ncbi:MAG: thiamine pyrophosphate-binding protein [Deltaproteobacteria bacterium]|nr:thiamine pyrophosphate-binding protein [Deltaproteobacteria bacterium]
METVTGGQLVADGLTKRGVKYVFTLSGGHITPIYQYLENSHVTLFDTRHEQAAVFMAEAWGKLTRTPGVAMVTAGPGFTNSLTGIASAFFSNTPLVLIAGCVGLDHREKLDLQDMPQAPVIGPMVKKALVCHKVERVPEFMDIAFRTASSGRPGPVYLEFPVDVLNAQANPSSVKEMKTDVTSHPADLAKAEQMIDMIQQAEKPIVIAGTGVWQSGAEKELIEFIENTGIPVYTSLSGRGTIPDTHPLCFEGALAIRPGSGFSAYMQTDLVVLLGTRICLYYMFGDIFNRQAKVIQVDIQPEEIGRNRTVDLPVVSDVGALLRRCNTVVREKKLNEMLTSRFAPWISTLETAHEQGKAMSVNDWKSDAVPIHPMRLAREINEFMNREDDIVVTDGGDTATWMGMTRTIRKPGHYLDYGIFGSLAVGIPYANAAKLIYPEKRVCLITGDGSVGFNFMEFETALRRKLPIVVVICNDLGWGMIRHSQEIRMGHSVREGTHIGRVDYHRMVEALGGKGILVEQPAEIRPALEAAFASGITTCINVMTDQAPISPASIALANVGAYMA